MNPVTLPCTNYIFFSQQESTESSVLFRGRLVLNLESSCYSLLKAGFTFPHLSMSLFVPAPPLPPPPLLSRLSPLAWVGSVFLGGCVWPFI